MTRTFGDVTQVTNLRYTRAVPGTGQQAYR
jgi:hypothetical protein